MRAWESDEDDWEDGPAPEVDDSFPWEAVVAAVVLAVILLGLFFPR